MCHTRALGALLFNRHNIWRRLDEKIRSKSARKVTNHYTDGGSLAKTAAETSNNAGNLFTSLLLLANRAMIVLTDAEELILDLGKESGIIRSVAVRNVVIFPMRGG